MSYQLIKYKGPMAIEVGDSLLPPFPTKVHSFCAWGASRGWVQALPRVEGGIRLEGRYRGAVHAKIYLLTDMNTVILSSQNAITSNAGLLEFKTTVRDEELWQLMYQELKSRDNYVLDISSEDEDLLKQADLYNPRNPFVRSCLGYLKRVGQLTEPQRVALRRIIPY